MPEVFQPSWNETNTRTVSEEISMICNICHQEKPDKDFSKSRRTRSGYLGFCKACAAEKSRNRYHSDPVYRRYRLDGCIKYLKERRERDPEFKKRMDELSTKNAQKRWRLKHPIANKKPSRICKIIRQHHLALKDDPEHLPTSFIQNLIGVECKI
jgi:hypothetical protein